MDEFLEALAGGLDHFETYLVRRQVESRRIDDGDGRGIAVRFTVRGHAWVAEFHAHGTFKQLVWT